MAWYTHKLIKSTAIAMAEEIYEECAKRDNAWYKNNRSRSVWVAKNWGMYVRGARQILTSMLGNPNVDEKMKEQIAEAIMQDRSIPQGDNLGVVGRA